MGVIGLAKTYYASNYKGLVFKGFHVAQYLSKESLNINGQQFHN